MTKYDMDCSGTLSEDEFFHFATRWFNDNGGAFFQRLIITSVVGMVILPESAAMLHSKIPFKKFIPKMAFKIIFGIGMYKHLSFVACYCLGDVTNQVCVCSIQVGSNQSADSQNNVRRLTSIRAY